LPLPGSTRSLEREADPTALADPTLVRWRQTAAGPSSTRSTTPCRRRRNRCRRCPIRRIEVAGDSRGQRLIACGRPSVEWSRVPPATPATTRSCPRPHTVESDGGCRWNEAFASRLHMSLVDGGASGLPPAQARVPSGPHRGGPLARQSRVQHSQPSAGDGRRKRHVALRREPVGAR